MSQCAHLACFDFDKDVPEMVSRYLNKEQATLCRTLSHTHGIAWTVACYRDVHIKVFKDMLVTAPFHVDHL